MVDSSILMMSVLLLWMSSGVQAVEANSLLAGSTTRLTYKVSTSRILLDFYVQCLFALRFCRLSVLAFKRSASKDRTTFFTACL